MKPDAHRLRILWTEMIDRDIDRLMSGRTPENSDIAQLEPIVSELRSLATAPQMIEADPDLISRAASLVLTTAETGAEMRRTERVALGLRRKVASMAASAMMLMSATGVAMASDSAVPGDWNYGIDRALEAIGIGDGGSAERASEQAVIALRAATQQTPDATETQPTEVNEPIAETVGEPQPLIVDSKRPEPVSLLLQYVLTADKTDGKAVSELARAIHGEQHGPDWSKRPDRPNPPNRPVDPGKPEDPGSQGQGQGGQGQGGQSQGG